MAKLVEYKIDGIFQRRVGEVVKEGSKYIYVRERHVGKPRILKLNIRENEVRFLFGANNRFDNIKGAARW